MKFEAPNGDKNYCYTLMVLDHVLCKFETLRFSERTVLKKARRITNPIGKEMLGERAIAYSKAPSNGEWNKVESPQSYATYPPFNPELLTGAWSHVTRTRRYESSECVLEVTFDAKDRLSSNQRLEVTRRELTAAMTALRLLDDAPIRGLGPIELRFHPAIAGGALGLGNPHDEVFGGKVEHGRYLAIDAQAGREVRALMKKLQANLPDALSIALARLHLSRTRGNDVDQFIDAIIGLEALYLGVDNNELSFRLGLRVAAHQETEPDMKWDIFKRVKYLYNARSALVHGSKHGLKKLIKPNSPYQSEKALLDGARAILRVGCRKALLEHKAGVAWTQYLDSLDKLAVCGG